MQETTQAKNQLSVPVAIIIAGAFIALAVYFSKGPSPVTQDPGVQNPATISSAISIRTISSSDHTLGNPSAPVSLVVYTDTECPFCKTFHATINQVADTYGKDGRVLIAYRHFPLLQIHPLAQKESEATECAADIGGKAAFWDFMNEIFKITPANNGLDPAELPKIASRIGLTGSSLDKFNDCLTTGKFEKEVATDYDEAVNAGGRGTPFSVFIVSKTLTQTSINTIEEINNSFKQQGAGEGPFTISTDKKRISMSGALPFIYVQRIVDLLLAN